MGELVLSPLLVPEVEDVHVLGGSSVVRRYPAALLGPSLVLLMLLPHGAEELG